MIANKNKNAQVKQAEALTSLFYKYKKDLNSYAFYKTYDHSLSDELVQDAFIKAWAYLVKNKRVHSMKAFLYHILRCLIIDQYRRRKTVSLDSLIENGLELVNDDHEKILDQIDGRTAAHLIQQLPMKYQTVIRMRYMQGMTLKEIAELTGHSKNNVTVQSCRGLKQLKMLYAAYTHNQ